MSIIALLVGMLVSVIGLALLYYFKTWVIVLVISVIALIIWFSSNTRHDEE